MSSPALRTDGKPRHRSGGPITLTDPALYRNEEPEDTVEPPEARAPTRSPGKSRKPRPR